MASDTSMDTPASERHTRTITGVIAKPDLFYGDRNKLEPWILQWDIFFHKNDKILEADKAITMVSYMRDRAQQWVTPKLKRYFDDNIEDDKMTKMFEEYDEFKEQLRKDFSIVKEPAVAEGKIQRLKQTGSVGDYATLFQQYSIQTEWNDTALKRMFKQGLKEQVRVELMRSGAATTTLRSLIDEAIRIDNDLYELRLENQAFANARNQRNPRQGTYRPNDKRPRQFYKKPRGIYETDGPEPMHVDNLERGKPRNSSSAKYHGKGKPDNGKETRTCYNCGKPGHLAKDCRQTKKNKVFRSVNMIERDGLDNYEEWEVVDPPEYEIMGPDSPASDSGEDSPATEFAKLGIQEIKPETKNRTPIFNDYIAPEEGSSPANPNYDPVLDKRRRNRNVDFGSPDLDGATSARKQKSRQLTDQEHSQYVKARIQDNLDQQNTEPHPGKRVDVWTYQTGSESPPYYRDNTDRVFYTPPDSPTLKREDAVVGQKIRASPSTTKKVEKANVSRRRTKRGDAVHTNNQEALILYEEDPVRSAQEARQTMSTPEYEDWVRQAEKKFAIRQERLNKTGWNSNVHPAFRYEYDDRNPTHAKLSWLACYHDSCAVHYSDKCVTGWFPSPMKKCRWAAFDCTNHVCRDHLWDKRTSGYFPGIEDTEAYANKALVNGKCTNDLWQTCLNPGCTRHKDTKQFNGFDLEPEPFLGQLPAPGIDPQNATTSTLHPSTSSQ